MNINCAIGGISAATLTLALIAATVMTTGTETAGTVKNTVPEPVSDTGEEEPGPIRIFIADKPPETGKNTVPDVPETVTDEPDTLELPTLPTYKKALTDYRHYRKPGTFQLALQLASYTDERGFRRYGDDYEAAMGSFYSKTIGDRFFVKFDSGDEITVVLADGKGDDLTDERHLYQPWVDYDGTLTANVLELIIDTDVFPKAVYKYGSAEKVEGLQGNIVQIKYLGRAGYNDTEGIFEPIQAAEK